MKNDEVGVFKFNSSRVVVPTCGRFIHYIYIEIMSIKAKLFTYMNFRCHFLPCSKFTSSFHLCFSRVEPETKEKP